MLNKIIFPFLLVVLFSFHVKGQTNLELLGNPFFCPGCERFYPSEYIEGLKSEENIKVELFYTAGIDFPADSLCYRVQKLYTGQDLLGDFNLCIFCPGDYYLKVTYTGLNNPIELTRYIQVSVFNDLRIIPLDKLDCDGASSGDECQKVCKGFVGKYTSTANNGQIVSYTVNGATSFVQNGNDLTITWGDEGQGTIFAFSNPGANCFGEASFCVDVLPDIKPEFKTPGNTFCANEQIPFEPLNLNGVTYLWNFGNGETSTDINPSTTYDTPGNYIVSLTMTNACGCTGTTSKEIIVKDNYLPKIDCKSTICENTVMTYHTDADCGILKWKIVGDGKVTDGGGNTDKFITVDWGQGPLGIIELEVSSCNFDLCPKKAVFDIPIISENAKITGPSLACKASTEMYTIQKYNATDYQWTVTGGSLTAGQGSNTIIVAWNNGNEGSISVKYNNCYLKCGGEDQMNVLLRSKYTLAIDEEQLCAGDVFVAKALNENNVPVVIEKWEIKNQNGNIAKTELNKAVFEYIAPTGFDRFTVISTSTSLCNSIQEENVTILPKSKVPGGIEGELAICTNVDYVYKANTTLGNVSFSWKIFDGANTGFATGDQIIVNWKSAGPYKLELQQQDHSGNYCPSNAISITPQKVNLVVLDGKDESCIYDEYGVKASFYEGMNYQWKVSPQDAATIVKQEKSEVNMLWSKAGTHTLTLSTCAGDFSKSIVINALPEPSIVHPDVLCEGKTVKVNTTASYVKYGWSADNGNFISAASGPEVLPGTYICEVTDAKGCSQKESFTINQLPKPNINISTPDETGICLSASIVNFPLLYALDAEDGYTYEWLRNNAGIGITTNTYRPSDVGAFSVKVVDAFGCDNVSNTIYLFDFCGQNGGVCDSSTCTLFNCASAFGTVDYTYNNSDCNEVKFTSTATNIIAGSEEWKFGDFASANNVGVGPNPSHDFTNAGFYNVAHIVTVDDSNNPGQQCLKWTSKIVTIPMKAHFDFTNACQGETIQFFDRSTFLPGYDITSWAWDFGDVASGADNVSNLPDPQHIYANEGSYTIKLIISNGTCTEELSKTITLHKKPSATILVQDASCEKETSHFLFDDNKDFLKAKWNFGDVTSGDNNNIEGLDGYHTFDINDNYTVTATIESFYGCTGSVSAAVQIKANTLSGNVSSYPGVVFCEGQSATLSAPTGGVSWKWNNEEVTSDITVNKTGIYQVVVKDANGCTYQTPDETIKVNPLPKSALLSRVYNDDEEHFYSNKEINFCVGNNLSVSPEDVSGRTYAWNSGATSTTIEYSETLSNQLAVGSHSIELTITETATGCSNTLEALTVKVNGLPGVAAISVNTSGILCEGISHIFKVSNPVGGLFYQWNTGKKALNITSQKAGDYFVVVSDANGCSAESNHLEIVAGPDISLVPSGCFERCAPDTMCFPLISGVTSFQWFNGGNVVLPAEGGDMPYIVFKNSGSYTLKMTGSNSCVSTTEPLNLTLKQAVGTVKGSVWSDVNANGIIDGGDTLVKSIDVQLGALHQPTNAGSYRFENVPAGTYRVEIAEGVLPAGAKAIIDSVAATIRTCDDSTTVDLLVGFDCIPNNKVVEKNGCEGSPIAIGSLTFNKDTVYVEKKALPGGCVDSTTYRLHFNPKAQFSLKPSVSCPEENNGSIAIVLSSGTNYTYLLNGQVVVPYQDKILGLGKGSYTVGLKDSEGCITESQVEVAAREEVKFSVEAEEIGCTKNFADLKLKLENYAASEVSIVWSNGKQGLAVTADEAGAYHVSVDNGCGPKKESFDVKKTQAKHSLKEYIVCSGHPLQLLDEKFVNDTLFQRLSVGQNGCTDTTSYALNFSPKYDFDVKVKGSCPGADDGEIEVIAKIGGSFEYLLNNQVIDLNDNTISGLYFGTYSLKIKDEIGCEQNYTIDLPVREKVSYDLNTEDISCFKGYADLKVELKNYDAEDVNISWSNGASGATVKVDNAGELTVDIDNGCEVSTERITIAATDKKPEFKLPNIISPIFDGGNGFIDLEKTEFNGSVIKSFNIYNRAGILVHSVGSGGLIWNGATGAYPLPAGVYVYAIEADVDICGEVEEVHKAGTITILR